jgi:hypothetical protein
MAGLANGPDGAHNRCRADTVKWAVGNLQRGCTMAIFLILLGCSLSSMGLGLSIGHSRGYAAGISGQRTWLKHHVPGLEDIDIYGRHSG